MLKFSPEKKSFLSCTSQVLIIGFQLLAVVSCGRDSSQCRWEAAQGTPVVAFCSSVLQKSSQRHKSVYVVQNNILRRRAGITVLFCFNISHALPREGQHVMVVKVLVQQVRTTSFQHTIPLIDCFVIPHKIKIWLMLKICHFYSTSTENIICMGNIITKFRSRST